MKILVLGLYLPPHCISAQSYPASAIPENLKKMLTLLYEKNLQRFRSTKLMK